MDRPLLLPPCVPLSSIAETRPHTPQWAPMDRHLVQIGYFTPSSKRLRHHACTQRHVPRAGHGQDAPFTATIVPSRLSGLPSTADQDRYLALRRLLLHGARHDGTLDNPVAFTSAALLHALGRADSGTHYREIERWLDVLTSTTIVLDRDTPADRKRTRDRVHVAERAVSCGHELSPGVVADRHYVWFSAWHLAHVARRAWVSIPWAAYCALSSPLARGLAPLVQLWAHAARHEGVSERRYDTLCARLHLRCYRHRSQIVAKLGPALNELTTHGFLAGWSLSVPRTGLGFKVVLHHRAASRGATPRVLVTGAVDTPMPPASRPLARQGRAVTVDPAVLKRLTDLGVHARVARQIVTTFPPDHDLQAVLAWVDHLVTHAVPGAIRNPAGLLVCLLRDRARPPASFLHRWTRRHAGPDASSPVESRRRHEARRAYEHYVESEAERHVDALDPADYEARLEAQRAILRAEYPNARYWTADTMTQIARAAVRLDMVGTVVTMSFTEFCTRHQVLAGAEPEPP